MWEGPWMGLITLTPYNSRKEKRKWRASSTGDNKKKCRVRLGSSVHTVLWLSISWMSGATAMRWLQLPGCSTHGPRPQERRGHRLCRVSTSAVGVTTRDVVIDDDVFCASTGDWNMPTYCCWWPCATPMTWKTLFFSTSELTSVLCTPTSTRLTRSDHN